MADIEKSGPPILSRRDHDVVVTDITTGKPIPHDPDRAFLYTAIGVKEGDKDVVAVGTLDWNPEGTKLFFKMKGIGTAEYNQEGQLLAVHDMLTVKTMHDISAKLAARNINSPDAHDRVQAELMAGILKGSPKYYTSDAFRYEIHTDQKNIQQYGHINLNGEHKTDQWKVSLNYSDVLRVTNDAALGKPNAVEIF